MKIMNMASSGLAGKIRGYSFYIPLIVIGLLTYGLLSLMSLKSEGILKSTKYVLTYEDGMGFYDAPDGTEQMVMYQDDAAGADMASAERKEGERWMELNKVRVEKPKDGWAKVDIGDNGSPLYIEGQYVGEETTRTTNLPPSMLIFLMGALLYFLMLYPWWMILRLDMGAPENKDLYCRRMSLLLYAASAYFILICVMKFIVGYNIGIRWFGESSYTGSILLVILNVIVGIIGAVGLGVVLLRYYTDHVNMGDKVWTVFRNLGIKGVILLVAGLYFFLIFLGIVVAIILAVVTAVCLIKLFYATGGFAAIIAAGKSGKVRDASGREMDEIAPGVLRDAGGKEYERNGPGYRERGNSDAPTVMTPGEEKL